MFLKDKWPRAQATVPGTVESPQEKGVKMYPVCGLVKAANGHNKLRYKFDWS